MSTPERPAPARDSKSTLYDAAVAVLKSQEEATAARIQAAQAPRRRWRWRILLLLIGLAGAALLLWRPVWLAGPKAPTSEPPGIAAASLRLALLQERQGVADYLKLHGHPPVTLAEVGGTREDFQYQVTGPTAFQISGRAGDSLITLRSSDLMTTFLGRGLLQIRNRGRR